MQEDAVMEHFNDTFCLTVNFEQNITMPHLLFQSISEMIIQFQQIDGIVIGSIDSSIEPVFVLDELEKGSIKVWLKQTLKVIPDSAIEDLSVKKILGHYLVIAKHKILSAMGEGAPLTEISQIDKLALELKDMAINTNYILPEAVVVIDSRKLLDTMAKVSEIAARLPGNSNFQYEYENNSLNINEKFIVPEGMLDSLDVNESIENKATVILKIKQPDYLGNSKWVFKYNDTRMVCGFEDEEWLRKFHAREIILAAGDSLKVLLKTITSYNKKGEVVLETHAIVKVIEILVCDSGDQIKLLE